MMKRILLLIITFSLLLISFTYAIEPSENIYHAVNCNNGYTDVYGNADIDYTNNGFELTTGKVGNGSCRANATTDYLDPSHDFPDFDTIIDNWLVCVWVKFDNDLISANQYVVSSGYYNRWELRKKQVDDKLYFILRDSSGAFTELKGGSTTGTDWNYYCGSYDTGTGDMRYFINGNLVDSGTTNGGISDNNNLEDRIGKITYDSGTQGNIDEYYIWYFNSTDIDFTIINKTYNSGNGCDAGAGDCDNVSSPIPPPSGNITAINITLNYPINETHYNLNTYSGWINLTTNLNATCSLNNNEWVDYCYQESESVINQTGIDGNCNLNYTGNYVDVSTTTVGIINVTFIKAEDADETTLIRANIGKLGDKNISINSSCFNYDNNKLYLQLRSASASSLTYYSQLYCYDGSWILMLEDLVGGSTGAATSNIGISRIFDGNWSTGNYYLSQAASIWWEPDTSLGSNKENILYEIGVYWGFGFDNSTFYSFYNPNPTYGNNSITATCTNGTNTTSIDFWFIIDSIDPIVNINFVNNSIIGLPFNLTVDYYDEYIYRTNTTVYLQSTGQILYQNYSGDLPYLTYNYNVTYPLNLYNSTYNIGDYVIVNYSAVDTHTANKFKEKPKSNTIEIFGKKVKEYNLKKGNIRFEYDKDLDIEEQYAFDRMQFKLKSDKLKGKETYQYVEADKIVYYPESEYDCHMIINDKYWYDCVGMKNPKVTKERNNRYKIDFLMDSSGEVITKSLGGLNEINGSIKFKINKNYTGLINKGDYFKPPNKNFSYTSLDTFTVGGLNVNETCIKITGSNVSSYDGSYCWNFNNISLSDVALFYGATPLDCYLNISSETVLYDVFYNWYDKSSSSVKNGTTNCQDNDLCNINTLAGTDILFNQSYSCGINASYEWFYFINQTVSMNSHSIDRCNGIENITLVNISYFDEITNEPINATNNYAYQIYDGNGYYSLSGTDYNSSLLLCTDYNEADVNLLLFGEFSLISDGYITRVFNIPEATGNTISTNPYTNLSYYLIGIANSTTITYTWKTTDYQSIDGTMLIYRCELNGSRTLIDSTSIANGNAYANLRLYTTIYSYAVVIDGETYTESEYYSCHTESVNERSYQVDVSQLNVLPAIGLYLIDCVLYNTSATTVKMEWDANDEDATDLEACIIGWREDIYGRTKVYESCVNQSSGSITRNIALTGFNYYVTGELTQNGVKGYCQDTVIFNQRSNTSITFGVLGIFLAAILILSLGLLAAGDNYLVIIFSIVGVLGVWFVGIVSFNWFTISSIIMLGIILALIYRFTLKEI